MIYKIEEYNKKNNTLKEKRNKQIIGEPLTVTRKIKDQLLYNALTGKPLECGGDND